MVLWYIESLAADEVRSVAASEITRASMAPTHSRVLQHSFLLQSSIHLSIY
jgi:hypothetical protein